MSDATHLSLIAALKDWADHAAWQRFADQYGPTLRAWAFRWSSTGRHLNNSVSHEIADEVAQEILSGIRERMRSYCLERHRPGGFRRWLFVTVSREVDELLRRRRPDRGSGDSAVLDQLAQQPARADLESELNAQLRQELIAQACETVRRENELHWQIIEALGLDDGRTEKRLRADEPGARPRLKDVAEHFNMSPSAVAKIKQRMVGKLRTEAARLLAE